MHRGIPPSRSLKAGVTLESAGERKRAVTRRTTMNDLKKKEMELEVGRSICAPCGNAIGSE